MRYVCGSSLALCYFYILTTRVLQLIITQEMVRTGARGYADGMEADSSPATFLRLTSLPLGLLGGSVIGLPPVLNFGSPEIKAKVALVFVTNLRSLSTMSLGRPGNFRGQEVHLSCNFRGAGRKRCAGHEDHRS
jgi:hypothetical protein